ncbi:hypothetical protein PCANC_04360 [Puccinia coronata f. sp. avenae]|uniref:Retrotransposon gag domain-containing protein n=1 Tax=Puccinia coronata f. sp. avenae TaxID=200324 RepID=A0A2N5T948_9BASI|nr:hypothetical protein PCANC_04360 [Puccinia coronata f. sp. avenae]
MKPPRLPDVGFSGDSGQLLSFLWTIRDHLRPRVSFFESDTRHIIWISHYFGYAPSSHRRGTSTSPVENWYTLLVTDNARRQGLFNPYSDLDGMPFTIPALSSVESFLDALIAVFGDCFMKENAKRALSACKQGNATIGGYNSRFSSLVYLVENVEEARVEHYVSGLNPRIVAQAMSKEWRRANTLDACMDLATEAAAQLKLLSLLPSNSSHHSRKCPFSSAPPPGLSFPLPHQNPPARDPNEMEIDAATVRRGSGPPLVFDQARAIYRAKNLCFRCLKPTVPFTHTGSLNCPNSGVTGEQRKVFVAQHWQNPSTSVLAVDTSHPPEAVSQPLTYRAPVEPGEHSINQLAVYQVDPEAPVLGNHQGFDEVYKEFDLVACAIEEVPIATVHICLDCSKKGRILVPASFKGPDGVWATANILVDTGAMANFEGVGGLVTQDWAGVIRLTTTDSTPVPLGSSFGVTRLGSIDAIFGLPWLD